MHFVPGACSRLRQRLSRSLLPFQRHIWLCVGSSGNKCPADWIGGKPLFASSAEEKQREEALHPLFQRSSSMPAACAFCFGSRLSGKQPGACCNTTSTLRDSLSETLQSLQSLPDLNGNCLLLQSRQPALGDVHRQLLRSLRDDVESRQWQSHQPSDHAFFQSLARD